MWGSFKDTILWQTLFTLCCSVEEVRWKIFLGLSCAFFGTGGLWAEAYSSVNWQLHLSPENRGAVSPRITDLLEELLWDLPKAFSLHCKGKKHLCSLICILWCVKRSFSTCAFLTFFLQNCGLEVKKMQNLAIRSFSVFVKKATGWEITRQNVVATPLSPP